MEWAPHVTVATIVERDNRFLLVYENSDGDKVYNQPAGHLDPNETLLEAAVRETREETGWIVEPTHVLGVSQYLSPLNGLTYLRTTFIARAIAPLVDAVLDTDIIEAVWLTYEEILARRDQLRSPLVLRDIEQYLAGVRYPLSLVYSCGVGVVV